jgi:hypothetical protein
MARAVSQNISANAIEAFLGKQLMKCLPFIFIYVCAYLYQASLRPILIRLDGGEIVNDYRGAAKV